MTGPGYSLEVPWAVRFTWTGDYLHDAYWSVGEQGLVNVSHGCVNMAPADAQTYYQMEHPGDPVTITGSPRPGVWDNGWTVWFLSWKKLVRGQCPAPGGAGRPGREQVRQPVLGSPVHGVLPASDGQAAQCRGRVTRDHCPAIAAQVTASRRAGGGQKLPSLIPWL